MSADILDGFLKAMRFYLFPGVHLLNGLADDFAFCVTKELFGQRVVVGDTEIQIGGGNGVPGGALQDIIQVQRFFGQRLLAFGGGGRGFKLRFQFPNPFLQSGYLCPAPGHGLVLNVVPCREGGFWFAHCSNLPSGEPLLDQRWLWRFPALCLIPEQRFS